MSPGSSERVDVPAADASALVAVKEEAERAADEEKSRELESLVPEALAPPVGARMFAVPLVGGRLRAVYDDVRLAESGWRVVWPDRTPHLDDDTVARIRPDVVWTISLIQSYSAWAYLIKMARDRIVAWADVGGFLAAIVVPLVLTSGSLASRALAMVVAVVVWAMVLTLVAYALSDRHERRGFGLSLLILAAAIVGAMQLRSDGALSQGLEVGLSTAVAAVGLATLVDAAMVAAQALIWRWENSRHPAEELVNMLCWALRVIEENRDAWRTPEFRQHLASNLEYLARRVELGMPRMLRTGDRHADRWLRDEAAMRAAVVRT